MRLSESIGGTLGVGGTRALQWVNKQTFTFITICLRHRIRLTGGDDAELKVSGVQRTAGRHRGVVQGGRKGDEDSRSRKGPALHVAEVGWRVPFF